MKYKFWSAVDSWAHEHTWIPGWIQHWVCDKFDVALGLYDDE